MGYYENPRAAKTLVPIRAKVVGKDEYVDYRAGKKCLVQRDPNDSGQFIIYFENNRAKARAVIYKFLAKDLPETIEFLDRRHNM